MLARLIPLLGMLGAICLAQVPNGLAVPDPADFAAGCGIHDVSPERAKLFRRSAAGEWSAINSEDDRYLNDTSLARVWHEMDNWMVDVRETQGTFISEVHSGQMCFDPQGRILRMVDRFVVPREGLMRLAMLSFALDGHMTRSDQKFVNVAAGVEVPEPEEASGFPEAWPFRRLDQLPFYSLLKK
jgi:hypothetical protein